MAALGADDEEEEPPGGERSYNFKDGQFIVKVFEDFLAAAIGVAVGQLSCIAETHVKKNFLGWHICRTKLARIFYSRHEFSHEKCSDIFPEMFEPLFCVSEKSRKIRAPPPPPPQNFPQNLPPKNKKITDELLQERREKNFRGPWLANPRTPYSIQKRPEPQISANFVLAIFFGGFQSLGGLKFV